MKTIPVPGFFTGTEKLLVSCHFYIDATLTKHKIFVYLVATYCLEQRQYDKQQITTAMDKRKKDALFFIGVHIPSTDKTEQDQRQNNNNPIAMVSRNKETTPGHLNHYESKGNAKEPEKKSNGPQRDMAFPLKKGLLLQMEPSKTIGSKQQDIQGKNNPNQLDNRVNIEHGQNFLL
jgi:hypothetical protein